MIYKIIIQDLRAKNKQNKIVDQNANKLLIHSNNLEIKMKIKDN